VIIHIRSKIVPENSSTTLVPNRIYKENRANWNANYQSDNFHANWSLPTWKESPSRIWNQSNQSNQMKNLRKVSAKQHYLSVARYVAGQSTNLPSRYIKFRNPIQKILIAYAMLIIGLFLVQLQRECISQTLNKYAQIHVIWKEVCLSQTRRSYDCLQVDLYFD